jgi:hypothetical protein
MRNFRTSWLPVAGIGLLALTGALAQQAAKPTSQPGTEKKEPPPRLDSKATAILDEAIRALDSKRHEWIETTLWQQVDFQGLSYQAEGTYLTAPDHRIHLELKTQIGGTPGKLLVISDGTTLWESMQVGQDQPLEVHKTQLKKVLELPNVGDDTRADYLQRLSFAGVVPLLQSIRKQMTLTGQDPLRWRDLDVIKLTAFWSESEKLIPPRQPWPAFLPRKCYVYVEASDPHWPHRIEWWGPGPPTAGDTLLLQMEFRNPRLDQPLSKELLERLFTFRPPDSARVQDHTAEVSKQLTAAKKKQ